MPAPKLHALAGRLAGLALGVLPLLSHAAGFPLRYDSPPPPAGWFQVTALDSRTYEIAEPKYWQGNVEYLLLGTKRALLFDSGPGLYDLRALVESLTSLPVIVIPSHLHFDHVGNLHEFDDVRLLDTPALRAQTVNGVLREDPQQFLLTHPIRFKVHGWVADGSWIDLGNRKVRVLATPGHTPDSVTVIDAPRTHRMFTGDLISRLTLVNVPGSDVHAMAASLQRLLQLAPTANAYEAHDVRPIEHAMLLKLARDVSMIDAGQGKWVPGCLGVVPTHQYDAEGFMLLLPAAPGQLMRPLGSATETTDWLARSCAVK